MSVRKPLLSPEGRLARSSKIEHRPGQSGTRIYRKRGLMRRLLWEGVARCEPRTRVASDRVSPWNGETLGSTGVFASKAGMSLCCAESCVYVPFLQRGERNAP